MRIKVKKDLLLKSLQRITNIIGTRSTLPVLANILFEAEENKLTLTTTDLELRITTSLEVEVEEPGKTTIRAKKLQSLVNRFIDNEVLFDCNEELNHTKIKCGTAEFMLLGLSADEFPESNEFTPVRSLKFKEAELLRILNQISYAVSLDDSRKVLHGLLFSIKEGAFTAVATDGKRLALVEKILDDFNGNEGDVIIPLKSANELKRLLEKDGEVKIELGEKQAMFETSKAVLTTKLIEGNYPNYRQVIPASFSKKVELPRELFISKLDLVSIALTELNAFVKMTFDNNVLYFEASSNEIGEGNDYIDIEYEDAKVEISFNPVYLSDPFKHSEVDSVAIKMNDGFSPVAVEGGEGFLYVIMPMRNK